MFQFDTDTDTNTDTNIDTQCPIWALSALKKRTLWDENHGLVNPQGADDFISYFWRASNGHIRWEKVDLNIHRNESWAPVETGDADADSDTDTDTCTDCYLRYHRAYSRASGSGWEKETSFFSSEKELKKELSSLKKKDIIEVGYTHLPPEGCWWREQDCSS